MLICIGIGECGCREFTVMHTCLYSTLPSKTVLFPRQTTVNHSYACQCSVMRSLPLPLYREGWNIAFHAQTSRLCDAMSSSQALQVAAAGHAVLFETFTSSCWHFCHKHCVMQQYIQHCNISNTACCTFFGQQSLKCLQHKHIMFGKKTL